MELGLEDLRRKGLKGVGRSGPDRGTAVQKVGILNSVRPVLLEGDKSRRVGYL